MLIKSFIENNYQSDAVRREILAIHDSYLDKNRVKLNDKKNDLPLVRRLKYFLLKRKMRKTSR